MLPPVLAPIVAQLFSQGLNLLGNAVLAKGQDVIEDKLGVKLDAKSPEDVLKLKELELDHEEFLVEAAQKKAELALEAVKVDNANTADARDMNKRIQESANASSFAKNAAYIIDFIIVIATLLLATLCFFKVVPQDNQQLVYMALGSLITMCGTILNFHRGTSASSHNKDVTITALSKESK